jgi:mono/diheme cytochrome c family protein
MEPPPASDGATKAMVAVALPPELSDQAMKGQILFDEYCSACHGANAAGSENGPPFVHKVYEPGHHADISFLLAIQRRVRAHHWKFGDMPPQPDVTSDDVQLIVSYVRELQRANGIN